MDECKPLAMGIVPKPLDAKQTADLTAMLENPTKAGSVTPSSPVKLTPCLLVPVDPPWPPRAGRGPST